MNKQKKQLLLLLFALILVIVAFFLVSNMPEEEETEEAVSYTVTDLNVDNVNKLAFTNSTGTYVLTKQDDIWSYEADKTIDLDETAVSGLAKRVAAISSENRMEQVADLSVYGLDEPEIIILISDGTTSYTLLVGDYNNITYTQYICLEEDMSTVYTTTAYNVSSFESGIDDLIVVEEETETETTQVQE